MICTYQIYCKLLYVREYWNYSCDGGHRMTDSIKIAGILIESTASHVFM